MVDLTVRLTAARINYLIAALTPHETKSMMKPETVAFLREIGIPEEPLAALAAGDPCTITGPSLTSWLRHAWRVGRYSARDHFVWHDVAELLGEPHAR